MLVSSILDAKPIDFFKDSDTLLEDAQIYIDKEKLDFAQIKESAIFQKSEKKDIHLGFAKDVVLWIKLPFYNTHDKSVSKILEVQNPLLESVFLYQDGSPVIKKGTKYIKNQKKSLNTTFRLVLLPHESKTHYLKISNFTTALRLGLGLYDEKRFLVYEYHKEMVVYIFFTVLFMVFVYNLLLYLYTHEKVYLLYCFYLFALIFQQSTYLGLTQIHMPQWFVDIDDRSVLFKVNLMYFFAALFSKTFLQTKSYPFLDRIYNLFIFLSVFEVPIFGTSYFYYPEVGIVTALVFIFFNLYAGIYVYIQGYKQARFFILGWIFAVGGFMLMILDGLGIISVIQDVSTLVMVLIALESVIISFAFVDRYVVLKAQKQEADALLIKEYAKRNTIIERRIKEQTASLNKALQTKEILFKELHHRVKNNLQLILSLIRIQADGLDGKSKEKFRSLEGRISAIAKAHQRLYMKDDLQNVDMHSYILEIYNDLASLCEKRIELDMGIESVYMPLREASYIGLIVNELLTNSFKYVQEDIIKLEIKMYNKNREYRLIIKDNASHIKLDNPKKDTLGITLVKMLVQNQLEGDLKIEIDDGLKYIMEFAL